MGNEAYRVCNWPEYNKALINRGSITLWIDEKSIELWYQKQPKNRKRGRPKLYSDIAIQTALTLKQVYRLTLRSCQGFMESLVSLLEIDISIPSYTQLCRRQDNIKLPRFPKCKGRIHLVVDSSGLKVFGEGEWKVRRHGWSKHRTWRKLHLGVDEWTGLIVTGILTGNNVGDDNVLPDLLKGYRGKLDQVSGDGGYDSHECFDEIDRLGARPVIPPQPNPRHKLKKRAEIKRPRDKVVWAIQELGRDEWKAKSGYHRRSLVETMFYRYKQLLGVKLSARQYKHQQVEALLRCHVLNKLTLLGMPDSQLVAAK